MAESFDPYREWLGIEPQDQPAQYYRLLGLATFESDAERIVAAAARAQSLIQPHDSGAHAAAAARLSAEVAFARRCLLDNEWRAIYDAQLRAAQSAPPVEKRRRKKGPPKLPPRSAKLTAREIGLALDSAALQYAPLIPLDGELMPEPGFKGAAPAGLNGKRSIAPPPPPPRQPPPAPPIGPFGGDTNGAGDPMGAAESGVPSDSMALRALVGFDAEPGAAPAPTAASAAAAQGASAPAANEPVEDVSLASRGARKALVWGLVGGGVAALLVIYVVALQGRSSARDSGRRTLAEGNLAMNASSDASEAKSASGKQPSAGAAARSEKALAAADDARPHPGSTGGARAPPVDPAKEAAKEAIAKLLIQAQDSGEMEPIEKALADGLDIETRDPSGRSLLRLAVMGDHRDLVETLIDKKAQVNTTDDLGETPLMSAAQRGNAKMVSLLLSSGASVDMATQANDQSMIGGFTALHLAARNGRLEAVNTLLEENANPDLADAAGVTPLMLACFKGSRDVVEALLLKAARADARDMRGQTALMYAVWNGDLDVIQAMLLREDVFVSARSVSGATAISIATVKGLAKALPLLEAAKQREAPMVDF